MAGLPYKIIVVDLGDGAGGGAGHQIGDPQMPISQFSVIAMTTGAIVNLVLGTGNDNIPAAVSLEVDLGDCDVSRQGLFAKYPVQVGSTITLAVTYAQGGRIGLNH